MADFIPLSPRGAFSWYRYTRKVDASWRSLTNTPTNYKGWQVVFPKPTIQLDLAALRQGGYPYSAMSSN
jgi:hypothetical protein